jgi:methylated-DNA-[protein]-cysteine S-methyltransferase
MFLLPGDLPGKGHSPEVAAGIHVFTGDRISGMLLGNCMKREMNIPASLCLRQSPFGPFAILWRVREGRQQICRVVLSRPGISAGQIVEASFSHVVPGSCAQIDDVAGMIEAFLHGEDIRFSLECVHFSSCSSFQQKVLRAEYEIPRGYVSTYKKIAAHVGIPLGARAVGTALAGNPFPIIIPCHRAIRTDGTLGGFQGGIVMKQVLLEAEGIEFSGNGHVKTEKVFY